MGSPLPLTMTFATAEVTEPSVLVILAEYDPGLDMRIEDEVAPGIAIPSRSHWKVKPAEPEGVTESVTAARC